MPVTRSSTANAVGATLQTSFHTNFLVAQKENLLSGDRKRINRVVASQDQLVALEALHKTSCSRVLTKDDVLKAASETGLAETWIRKWLTRKRHPRSFRATGQAGPSEIRICDQENSSQAGGEKMPGQASSSVAGSAPFLVPLARGTVNAQALTSNVSILDLLNDVPSSSLSVCRPEISRAYSDSALFATSHGISGAAGSRGPQRREDYLSELARTFAESPSLGYIPTLFSDINSYEPSSTSSGYNTHFNYLPISPPQKPLPAVPTFRTEDTQGFIGEGNTTSSYSMDSLMRLFQDVTEAQTQQKALSEQALSYHSPYLPGASYQSLQQSGMLSFAASLQSHSTSVVHNTKSTIVNSRARPSLSLSRSHHVSSQSQPLPVAYKARLADLGLRKRIRVASMDDLLAVTPPVLTRDEDSSGTSSSFSTQASTEEEDGQVCTPNSSGTALGSFNSSRASSVLEQDKNASGPQF